VEQTRRLVTKVRTKGIRTAYEPGLGCQSATG
jgi:hypothetical protein